MKFITLNAFALLLLITSCNTSKKATSNTSKDVDTGITISKELISIKNIKWQLVTLMGKDVSEKNAFITFSDSENKVYGNASCNSFNGTYQMKEGNQIAFSKIAATLMACKDMEVENKFMAVLEKADNYSLNGTSMTLNKARMAPLAIFKYVEDK